MDRVVLEALRARRATLDRDPAALYALARDRVRPHFDLAYSARLIAGSAWQGATPSARAEFVAAFEHYLVSSLRSRLAVRAEGFAHGAGPSQAIDATRAMLPVRVVMDDGARIETEVHFRLEGGAWRIWDVRASGMSFVRQYRGDFGTEARTKGLDACTRSLEEIAQRNESELRERLRETGSIRRAR